MIICAALQILDVDLDKIVDIIAGVRHPWCYQTYDTLYAERHCIVIEGFLTDKNEFLNREKAYDHALMCNQISPALRQYKKDHDEYMLYSEDLY